MSEQNWQRRAVEYRAKLDACIPAELRLPESWLVQDEQDLTKTFPFSKYLDPLEMEITESRNVQYVTSQLRSGAWTAVQVTTAFLKRAALAHQLTRCLSGIYWDRAMTRARELDDIFKKRGPIGRLHGLPISLKDQLDIAGEELTMSYIGWIGNISKKNALLVDILLEQGAVLYCRTTVPQTLMIGETYSNLFGTTTNPHKRILSPGGSSGGEGALLALGGSVLGVGSDIGGSIRVPSGQSGCYGLRPSTARVPYLGASNSCGGQEGVSSVLGPLSVSPDGLKAFMQAVLQRKPWERDPQGIPLPWRQDEYELVNHNMGRRLCFAFMWDDGCVKPMAPNIRALQITRDALLAAGHEVIDWMPYKHQESWDILSTIWTADGGKDCNAARALSGEPQIKGVYIGKPEQELNGDEYWRLMQRKLQYRKEYLDIWNETVSRTSTGRPVDAIICPVNCSAPAPHQYVQCGHYTTWVNVQDWVASVFPVTKANARLDPRPPPHEFRSQMDKAIYESYDPEKYEGGPIGVQVITRRYTEEANLRSVAVARELTTIVVDMQPRSMLEICDAAVKAFKAAHRL